MRASASTPDRQAASSIARRVVLAIALAYVLVLQSLFGGLATGAFASAALDPNSDAHIICRGAVDLPDQPEGPAHHTPDCCVLGCPGATGSAMAPAVATVPAPAATFAFAEPTSAATPAAPTANLRLAHPPRAPPLA